MKEISWLAAPVSSLAVLSASSLRYISIAFFALAKSCMLVPAMLVSFISLAGEGSLVPHVARDTLLV